MQEGAGGDGAPARLAWRLEYPQQQVFFALDIEERRDGTLGGKGDVYAAPRSEPKAINRVGDCTARRVSREWDLRNPVVARIATDKELPVKERSTGVAYPF